MATTAQPVAGRSPAADPRPRAHYDTEVGEWLLTGGRCQACGAPAVTLQPRCAECRGDTEPEAFGPGATVYSCTTVHVPQPGLPAPYRLAYVDFEKGPRALVHVTGGTCVVGDRVRLVAPSEAGNLQVEVQR